MKNRVKMLSYPLVITIFCLCLQGCANTTEQPPTAEQNHLLQICTKLLVKTNEVVEKNGAKLPKRVKHRVLSLLASAEISSQFEAYPTCVDKLERVRYFLNQANYKIPTPSYETGKSIHTLTAQQ